jgi:hypothetical protein
VKLTRHARNRLRWIGRRHPNVTEARLIEELSTAWPGGYDQRWNRRVRVSIGETQLTLVINESSETVITMWME